MRGFGGIAHSFSVGVMMTASVALFAAAARADDAPTATSQPHILGRFDGATAVGANPAVAPARVPSVSTTAPATRSPAAVSAAPASNCGCGSDDNVLDDLSAGDGPNPPPGQ